MKLSDYFTLSIAALAQTASSLAIHKPRASGFASVDGTKFNIDGTTAYYAGSNAYWLGFLMNNGDVDTVLDHFQQSGLKILRIWGFNDVNANPANGTVWYQSMVNGSQPVINTGADGLQRLDYAVQAAEQRDIKLIINFVNNWGDYGGMPAYMNYFGGSGPQDWYTNTQIQAQYQKYIQAVVSRYSDSSAIFAWELANEPRCKGCDTSVITNWAKTTSQYIKSLDANHMVTLGDEGMGLSTGSDGSYPYTTSEGVNFNDNLAIDTLDFGTMHLYPSSWGVSNDWGNAWITNHGQACSAAGKPCLLEEYGVQQDHCSVEGQWQKTALTSVAADLFWDLGDTISTGQTPNDGNTIYYGTSDWTCLVTDHINDIKSSGS